MRPTLLEKAKKLRAAARDLSITDEHVELAIAWARSQISYSQVQRALETKNAYPLLARALRESFTRNSN